MILQWNVNSLVFALQVMISLKLQTYLNHSRWRNEIILQSNLDYPDLLGVDKIVQIIENMNINEEQKLIKFRKQHLIMKQNI